MEKETRNSAYTKQYNRKRILSTLLKHPMSRADLAREIGLTRAAITIIIDSMLSEGLLIEKGTVSNGLGRNPVVLDVRSEACYALGLSIVRNGCCLGVVDLKGKVLFCTQINIEGAYNRTQALEKIKTEIKTVLEHPVFKGRKFQGLGITSPGPLDSKKGIIINPPNFKHWHNTPIVDELKKVFDFQIKLENNASALALAEKNYGQGRNFSDFILIVVDNGIGAGVITNGKLSKGANSLGVELGHTSICYNGKPCNCGNLGCLEVYAAIPAVLKDAQILGIEVHSWDALVQKAESGHKACIKLVEQEADYLSTSIINSVNVLGIEAVVLSGHIKRRSSMLLNRIRERVNTMAINRDSFQTEVCLSGIKDSEDIVAAASVVFEELL